MNYKIADLFTSIIGEGIHTGTPAAFIRLAGCNLNCPYCDTNYVANEEMNEEELASWAKQQGYSKVVLTGGEPLMQDVALLVDKINHLGMKVHLETNGILLPPGIFYRDGNWVAVSPKSFNACFTTIERANEVKFLCGIPSWEEIINRFCNINKNKKWLMPITKGGWENRAFDNATIQTAIDYCMKHSDFTFATQIHKYLNIK
jgi:7-carboxy-7-deazaguanine synthase